MKKIRRLTALFLTLATVITLISPSAWGMKAHASELHTLEDLHVVHINPLFDDVVTEADLVKPDDRKRYAVNSLDENYCDAEMASEVIREDMVARETTIIVNTYCESSIETYADDAKQYLKDLFGYATMHTGNPTEGDYILWHYKGYNAKFSNLSLSEGILYMTITLTMTYRTTAAQEAELDVAVAELLNRLNVSGADDYTKLKAAYDYICANITYDYENLNNEAYMLQYTAYAALINGTSVCQGYALLLYRLALELGVDCRLIAGIGNNDRHGWNIAKLDGMYYNLDATWDAGNSTYRYFLVSTDNFDDHTRFEEYETAEFHQTYPMATKNYTYSGSGSHGHSHSYYGTDANKHWSICSCGEMIAGTVTSHQYYDGQCICGVTCVKIVNNSNAASYSANGQIVTVKCDIPCRIGYWNETMQKYIAVTATPNENGSYNFSTPAGITEILVVTAGEMNEDGKIAASDIATLNGYIRGKRFLTAETVFAADVNGDGVLDKKDISVLSEAILGKAAIKW